MRTRILPVVFALVCVSKLVAGVSVVGGNAEMGLIDSNGNYTAPATMPSANLPATGSTLTIRCQSVAEPAVFQELVITLYPQSQIQSFGVGG